MHAQTDRSLTWSTGNHSSMPSDQRAYLETDDDDRWVIYKTDDSGQITEDFQRHPVEPFRQLEDAQAWVENNVQSPEHRSPPS